MKLRSPLVWTRYVAVGDSFTEGLDDPYADGSFRGWSDRLAALLHAQSPELKYANLAVRGRKTDRIVSEQIPQAIAQGPDLVTFASGINDLMGRTWDSARTFERMSAGLAALRASGADVLVIAFGDPIHRRGSTARWRDRFELLNRATVDLARNYGCHLLDFWPLTDYSHDAYWGPDRLHLSALGHEITARAAAEVLGIGDGRWRDRPHPETQPMNLLTRVADDIQWFRTYAAPWMLRRLRGTSSGDVVQPKRPVLSSLAETPLPALRDSRAESGPAA